MSSLDMDIRKASRFLSHHLECDPGIGSEDTVNVRRLVDVLCNGMTNTSQQNYTLMTSGSKGDGFDFASSDDDFMFIHNNLIVVQPDDEISEKDINKTILVMDTTDCRPGFTLLRLHQVAAIQNRKVMDAMTEINGSRYLSSVVYSSNMLLPGHYLHGPCSTLSAGDNKEYNCAHCFHCRSWPDSLSDFRYRTIHCAWPSRELVNYIVRNGCHFVAIGDKHSSLFAMQLRISFAKAERSLVMSFNYVQLKTYALLKMFLKECIERDESMKDLLCSYFMKTLVFHAIEHSTGSMWVDDNIVQCFWFCFTILLQFVQTGYCPNYFVLSHNMFLSNVIGDNRTRLRRVLNRYQYMGWNCLFQCSSLQSLPQTIQDSRSIYPMSNHHHLDADEFRQDIYVFVEIWRFVEMANRHLTGCNMACFLKLVNRVFLNCSDENLCDIALLYLINAITITSSNSITDLTRTHNNSNKNVYRQIRKNTRLLHVSSAADVCRGLLSLATGYYNVGCYSKAADVATRVVFACQQRALLRGAWTEYKEEMCGKGYTLLQKAKRSFVYEYIINTEDHKLYPPELDIEVQTNDCIIRLPPLPYALFLLVLSTYRLGNTDQSRTIIDDLMAVRTNQIDGVHHYPIVHNLIGICHQLLGDTRQAIKAFEDSCRELPDNPAAAIRISDIQLNQSEEQPNTDIGVLDYCNVPCQYHRDYECVDDDDDDDEEMLYYHKTMYNTDPVSFVDMSWFSLCFKTSVYFPGNNDV